jgi:hypothetical protein
MDGEKRRRLTGPLRAGLVAGAVALLVVPLAALGESEDGSSSDADRDQARQKFEDCLRDNGRGRPGGGRPAPDEAARRRDTRQAAGGPR